VIEDGQPSDATLTGATGGQPHRQPESPPEVGQLLIYAENRLVRSFALNVPVVTIGRTPANVLPLQHPSVSRTHADLRVSPEGVILTDRGSANGTFVNDTRLAPEQPVQLVHGSSIRIGPFVLRYQATSSTPEPSPATQPPTRETPAAAEPSGAGAEGAVAAHPDGHLQEPAPPAVYVPAPPPRARHPVPLPVDPVSSYLDFLPVIFQDGDFLGRFLLLFQSIWEPLEHRQDHMDMYFDAKTCPAPFLQWLADWLGVNIGQVTDEGRLRGLIGEAVELYRWRGTRYGLTRLIEICTGVTPIVAETPNNPAVLHIRVALPAKSNVDRDMIERLVKEHKPAHTAYLLEVFS
jgi:phage tail-like protein